MKPRFARSRAPPCAAPGRVLLALALLYATGAHAAALRIVVLSDFNGSYGSTEYHHSVHRAVAATAALEPDLVLSTGDMIAGQRLHPPLSRAELEMMWTAFHATVSDPLRAAGLEFVATAGNHDASVFAPFTLEREIYREQWRHREPAAIVDRGDYPFHFAFSVGDALLISLDATAPGHLPHAQRDWLERILTEQGPRFRWRIVFGHLPIWPLVDERRRDVLADGELERMLVEAGTTVYLSGHHHAYYPGIHGGLAQIGQACLGAAPRHLIGQHVRSARALTVLDFADDGMWTVRALTGDNYSATIDHAALPAKITSRLATVTRLDQPVSVRAASSGATEDR